VDDFGVQYMGQKHAQHLIYALETEYTVSKYWTGGIYCGITLKWDYENKHVDISMHGYIKDTLHKYQHHIPNHPQYEPHKWTVPAYGQRIKYAPLPDASYINVTINHTCPNHCGNAPLQCSQRRPNPYCALEYSIITAVNSHISHHICCITSP
jgi:hypothetical protein